MSAHDKVTLTRHAAPAPSAGEPLNEGAVAALASYQQGDADGVMVLVSRQAIDECLPHLRAMLAAAPTTGETVQPDLDEPYAPTVIHFEERGDWELVLRDVPIIEGEPVIGETLLDFDRKIVGVRWRRAGHRETNIEISDEAVEAVARTLCAFEGTHPDRLQKTITGEEGLPMWTRYELLARGAIFAAAPFFRQHPAALAAAPTTGEPV